MRLPDTAGIFTESIQANSKLLIERGFWDIQEPRLEKWFNQFCGPEERFFAACLLDQVIFRTRRQFEAGLRTLFRSNLSGKLFNDQQDLHLMEVLRGRSDQKLRLVPVICESDPPTKSGPFVMRRLQRILQLNHVWMRWPWQATSDVESKGVETILFVDDFLGSGHQFVTFFNHWKFDEQPANVKFYYAPVVAHQQGIDYLARYLPDLCVVPIEILGESHGFFSEKVWRRLGQGSIFAADAKSWYIDFCSRHDIMPIGYGDLALTFGFSHATPDNTLPILWSETDTWQPLLER